MSHFAYEIEKGLMGYDAGPAEVKTDDAAMSARFRITTTHVDRDGDIVETKGLDWSHHKNNPVVYFEHHRILPFPVALSQTPAGLYTVEPLEAEAFGTAYFKQDVRESVQIYQLVKSGLLRAASIGFIPKEMTPRTKGRGMHHTAAEVTEWSVVGVPANAHALRAEIGKGLLAGSPVSDELKRALEPHMAERAKAWANGAELEDKGGTIVATPTLGEVIDAKAAEGKAADPDPEPSEDDVIPDPDPADAPDPAAAAKDFLGEDELLISVTCPRSAFGGYADAKKWCRSKGYSTDIVLPTDAGWQFAQSESALEPLTDFRQVELEAGTTGLVAKQLAVRLPKYVTDVKVSGKVVGGLLELTTTKVYNDGREASDVQAVECSGLFDATAGLDPEGVPDDLDAFIPAEAALTAEEQGRITEVERAMRSNLDGIADIRRMFRQLTGK